MHIFMLVAKLGAGSCTKRVKIGSNLGHVSHAPRGGGVYKGLNKGLRSF